MTSRILKLAFYHKAQQIGKEKYTIMDLERDCQGRCKITDQAIRTAIAKDHPNPPLGPIMKFETVQILFQVLLLDSAPLWLQDSFYVEFGHPPPHMKPLFDAYVDKEFDSLPEDVRMNW